MDADNLFREARIAAFDTIVHVLIERSAEALIIQAHQPQRFPQIFLKIMESSQMLRQSGHATAFGCSEKLLISSVHQQPDLVADHHSGLSDNRLILPAILYVSGAAELRNPCARAVVAHLKTKLTDIIQVLAEAQFVRFLIAEEHAVSSL